MTLELVLFRQATAAESAEPAVRSENLLQSNSSLDGESYKSYRRASPNYLC